jgi:hypothetical protein
MAVCGPATQPRTDQMHISPAFHSTLRRLRFGVNTVAISATLLSTIVTICLNHETRSLASAILAACFFACFAFLWGFVREDIQERETLTDTDL